MAQNPRLIPDFPNDISIAIIDHLLFLDLVSAYFVSKRWQDFIDNDKKASKALFRLPQKERDGDIESQVNLVEKLWQKLHDKDSIMPAKKLWDCICFNPLFNDPSGELSNDEYGSYITCPLQAFQTNLLLKVPKEFEQQLEDLWRSMLVTYPPITRMVVTTKPKTITIQIEPLPHFLLVKLRGIALGRLKYRAWRPQRWDGHPGRLEFWPSAVFEREGMKLLGTDGVVRSQMILERRLSGRSHSLRAMRRNYHQWRLCMSNSFREVLNKF